MVADFGTTRYCRKCDLEIIRKGEVVTMSADSKFCECDLIDTSQGANTPQEIPNNQD